MAERRRDALRPAQAGHAGDRRDLRRAERRLRPLQQVRGRGGPSGASSRRHRARQRAIRGGADRRWDRCWCTGRRRERAVRPARARPRGTRTAAAGRSRRGPAWPERERAPSGREPGRGGPARAHQPVGRWAPVGIRPRRAAGPSTAQPVIGARVPPHDPGAQRAPRPCAARGAHAPHGGAARPEDRCSSPGRFSRLLRQANDAEIADVRKVGEDEHEVTPHRTSGAPAIAAPAAAAAAAQPTDERRGDGARRRRRAAGATTASGWAVRFRRGSRGQARQDTSLIGSRRDTPADPVAAARWRRPRRSASPRRGSRPGGRARKKSREAAATPATGGGDEDATAGVTRTRPAGEEGGVSATRRAATLPVSFFRRPADVVARELLGTTVSSTLSGARTAGRIVETEAYLGHEDPRRTGSAIAVTPRTRSCSVRRAPGTSTSPMACTGAPTWSARSGRGQRGPPPGSGAGGGSRGDARAPGRRRRPPALLGPGKLCQALALTRDEDGFTAPLRARGRGPTAGCRYDCCVAAHRHHEGDGPAAPVRGRRLSLGLAGAVAGTVGSREPDAETGSGSRIRCPFRRRAAAPDTCSVPARATARARPAQPHVRR